MANQESLYDIVIVGGGTSGCVLAARLSEDGNRNVLLVEAGTDYPDFSQLPDDLKYSYTNAAFRQGVPYDWGYTGVATPLQDKMPVPRAKVIGGCSSHNGPGPKFWRGRPDDYDAWASLGNDLWSYSMVLPYFKKLERDLDIQDEYHGSDGPVPVRRHKKDTWLPMQTATYQACVEAGFPEHPDINHPEYNGVAPRVENNIDGVRMSTALTYLNPSRQRTNLKILANSQVTRILLRGRRAVGIELENEGGQCTIGAKEVIIAAGAVASPQLLMCSGIGPGAHLSKLGIPLIQELPGVGQNLRDHMSVSVIIRPKPEVPLDPNAPRQQMCLSYTAAGSSTPNDMIITPISFATMVQTGGDPMRPLGVGFGVGLYLARGVGQLSLTSADIKVNPHLEFHYLEDSWDRKRLREGVRLCLNLLENPVYKEIAEERLTPNNENLSSDDVLDDWLLRNVNTSYHVSGTCKMGPSSDPMAVTDQYLRVHGIEGLRVVDASIMPDIIRANTNATTIMIGERGADLIKDQL